MSLAQGTFAALGAYTSAVLTLHYNWSAYASLPLALLVPGLIAFPLSYAVVRLSPLALAIATLLFGKIVDLLLRAGGDVTGGYVGLSGVPSIAGFEEPLRFHLLAWTCVIVVVWLVVNLESSTLGRAAHSIRHDTQRAAADGVPVRRVQAAVFTFGAMVAGLGGWLYAHYSSFLSPESLGFTVSISALLMAVVGGSRHALGPIAGTALLMLVVKYIPGAHWQGIFYGGALVAVLLIAPRGLLGIDPRRWTTRRHTRSEPI